MSIRVFADGTEEYLIQPTAWYYLKYLGESKLFLGLTLAAFAASTVIFAPFMGMFEVKYQAPKAIILMAGPLKFFGNLLYSIPVNGYFPLFGRFMSGIGKSTIGVLYGTVTKYTTNENRAKTFLYFEGAYTLGAIFGPAIGSVLIFHVNIFGWKINAGNSPGLLLAIVWFLLTILSMFLPSDLGENVGEEKVYPDSDNDSDDGNNKIISKDNSGYITSTVFCLFYIIFLNMVFYNVISFYTPLIAVYHLGLGLRDVKLIYVNCSLAVFIIFIATSFFIDKISEKNYIAVALISVIIPISITFYFALMWDNPTTANAGYLLFISMLILSVQFIIFALACSLLSKITPTKTAAFYQSLIFATDNIGVITARVVAGATFEKVLMTYTSVAMAIAWAIAVIWFAFEHKNLPQKALFDK